MRNGIMGGFFFGGLIACALFGSCGIILIAFGVICSAYCINKEKQEEKKANAWRKKYPTYKY